MKIAILSRNRKLFPTRRLKEAGVTKGYTVGIIDSLRCCMHITNIRPVVCHRGKG